MSTTTHASHANAPITQIDPFDEAMLSDPPELHRRIRRVGDVVQFADYPVVGVVGYDLVHAALNDPETYCSAAGVGLADFRKEKPWRPPSLLLEADPPDHTRARKVITRVLSPTAVRAAREQLMAATAEMFSDLVHADRVIDGMTDIANVYPPVVFGDLIGLPVEGREHLAAYGNMVFNTFGPRNRLFHEALEPMGEALPWIAQHCERAALHPDGLGAKIHAEAAAEGWTESEAALLVRSLLTAGVDTTVQSIGAALRCLAENPDQFAALSEQPKLARPAFEEAVRLISPVQTFFRTTTKATHLGKASLPAGQKVLLFLAGANRDPAIWEDPDRYDITRRAAGHVGFGSGIHACVGQMFARLEGEAVLTELARQCSAIEPAGEPVLLLNNTLHSLKSLPLRLHPATR